MGEFLMFSHVMVGANDVAASKKFKVPQIKWRPQGLLARSAGLMDQPICCTMMRRRSACEVTLRFK
jgi:hypothetical protein